MLAKLDKGEFVIIMGGRQKTKQAYNIDAKNNEMREKQKLSKSYK